jgi:NAD(P)-dependent dehydrogenase (short-subunit alcohol dehydrogenase family)/acyl carrier protein
VLDSGSLDLVDEVMALTGNRGVDVVLNMEARRMDTDGLRILAPCGRYVRLERGDGGNGGQDAAMALEGNLSLATVDVWRMMAERPDLFRRVLQEVEGRFQAPEFTPPYVRVFPATQVMEAFYAMKETLQPVVISLGGGQAIPVLPRVEDKTRIDADGTYLITGGFGGFGLKIAEWMVAQGARHLMLVGRHGAATPQAQEAVQALEAAGAQVLPAAADITREADVVRLLDELAAMPALKGIVHAAAVLDDAPLAELDDTRFTRTMAPKALGAWYLHKHTRNLDFFILFSSVSCLIGNARQGNYVAGNAFLDTLAHYRRARGLPATSINWGALAGVGMAAQSKEVERHLELMGIRAFRPAQALEALARVLAWEPVQIGIMDVDWQKWAQFEPTGGASPRFSNLVARDDREGESAVDTLCSELLTMEPGERKEILALMLAEQVAGTLRLPTDRIDLDQPLTHMGIDSLMAIELQTGINLRFGVEISTLELMKGNSITQMAEQFMVKMGIAGERIAVGDETMSFGVEASSTDWVEEVNDLSDEDVGKLLDELLV